MNFIFFIPDELRAESVGCYGHPFVETPNMDRMATEGVRFDQCFVQHTVCTPSRCSFMTGWYPHVRGHRSLWHLLQPDEPNLLKYLKQAGYHVYWNGRHNDLLSADSFADSVSEYHASGKGQFGDNFHPEGSPLRHSFLFSPFEGAVEDYGDMAKVLHAIEFLKSKPQEPFAIFLPLISPHPPYSAPKKWHDMYSTDQIPDLRPAELDNKPGHFETIRKSRRMDEYTDAEFKQVQATYLGMVSCMDNVLGQLLDALDETGYSEDTTTFFFSDH
jgi:choline-sulfatase